MGWLEFEVGWWGRGKGTQAGGVSGRAFGGFVVDYSGRVIEYS